MDKNLIIDELILDLDKELFNLIKIDVLNGQAYQMDDDTLDMLLTGLWEMGSDELINQGIIIGNS
ncbi:MAG: hypothetical protein H8E03_00335 [Pelagibacteraceae bacterium]|nr:hypothetical protein [Pelagibacteraceae bacterium]